MKLQKILPLALLTVLCSAFLSSCKTAEMYQSEALLQPSKELPVTGRKTISLKKDFKIGSFAVTDVHRGGVKTKGASVGPFSSQKVSQRFEFALQDSTGGSTYVSCEAGLDSKEIKLGKIFSVGVGGDDREVFVSTIHLAGGTPWKLITKDPGADLSFSSFLGILQSDDREIHIEPVYNFKNPNRVGSSTILGYEFRSGKEVLGAVQVLNKGKVWVRKDLSFEQQRLLSAASASLLLYQKLERTNPAEPQNAKVKVPISLRN
ncbi:hypothetical protein [Sabulibacter ruber]|uniref:hypothetical protein n=1 Tax=Sabulibacter ruber TaxID=2811901 RepID=UPI001A96267F|nr:hypothetical protein [Sabulibacter ruber]